ncbi:MGH1-like glycoside hydrolase domain-containing protein [Tateyamaria sp. SN6-1]|uniref:MGH1-like glycoside hydrolase domain-containing protein n=1 Tax=Tateyamaria sp. SN6-1 TaxID=3092148 RepID=UPI0039F5D22E
MKATDARDEEARGILARNDRGGYTIPTAGLYPYQWNWDSAFAAMGFAAFDIDRAWTELETLFTGQWAGGMVPHILFHVVDDGYFPGPDVWQGVGPIPSSGISQPPVAATMARMILARDPVAGAPRMAALYDRMVAWHRWFMDWRLDRGAVCITHPWEAGRDNAPDWDTAMAAITPDGVGTYTRRDITHVDSAMRPTKYDYDRYIWLVQRGARAGWDEAALLRDTPFRVADPTMTFILLRATRDLADMGADMGRDVTELHGWIDVLEAGAETLWNDAFGAYDSRDVVSGDWAGALSNASFLCWYGGIDRPDMANRLRHVLGMAKYGVPSLAPDDPRFDAKRYWRGPVWGMMNMMIGMGLTEQGYALGEDLRALTGDMIAEHGFAEYFDPLTGAPAGGGTFTWTAAVWLGWASPNAGGA